jgi:hypothetical protein
MDGQLPGPDLEELTFGLPDNENITIQTAYVVKNAINIPKYKF